MAAGAGEGVFVKTDYPTDILHQEDFQSSIEEWREEHDRNAKDLFDALRNARLNLLRELQGCIDQACNNNYAFGDGGVAYDRAMDIIQELWKELEQC